MKFSPVRNRAFTMIEIMVVITILVVMCAGVMPLFMRNSDSVQLKASARRLCDMMSLCQGLAVFENRTYRIEIDAEKSSFIVLFEKEPYDNPDAFETYHASGMTALTLQDGIKVKRLEIDREIDEDDPDAEEIPDGDFIDFRCDGTSDNAILVLAGENEECFSIAVSELTGRLRLYDHEIEPDEDDDE
jgi:prepilin-type N-terminal cleavage/methylation domain-containing protein